MIQRALCIEVHVILSSFLVIYWLVKKQLNFNKNIGKCTVLCDTNKKNTKKLWKLDVLNNDICNFTMTYNNIFTQSTKEYC